ncbi:GspH/FimT family pseudopilin [Pseudomonas amygdali]|uniref:GspH/FimT family pseudopilin n=1 Tax=Pseudomonas amygdali TaxID=47877 RepID=UPI0006E4D547|nr:GspH/FimT family pseudopilin [Pseudomonas amygdali]KPW65406.1 Type 4 fimbrial bioproteinsis protein FimT [Pseudomonas amygdali pv. ciccaronei]
MRHAGFTLIELLIVVALVAILANVATPSFKELIDSSRGLATARELASGIRSARAAAITRNQIVTLHAIENDWPVSNYRVIVAPAGRVRVEDTKIDAALCG